MPTIVDVVMGRDAGMGKSILLSGVAVGDESEEKRGRARTGRAAAQDPAPPPLPTAARATS